MTPIEIKDKTISIVYNNLFLITRKHYKNLLNKRKYWEKKYKELKVKGVKE